MLWHHKSDITAGAAAGICLMLFFKYFVALALVYATLAQML